MAGAASMVLLVGGITLMVVVHVVVFLWALRRGFTKRHRHASRVGEEHAEEEGGVGLSAEELVELPCHGFKEGGAGDCAVCLEAFRDGDRCRALPRCEHGFHAECVDSWLRKSRLCPICRAEVARPRKESGAAEVAVDVASLLADIASVR